jgi:iron(III) transport system ATP-binding protein
LKDSVRAETLALLRQSRATAIVVTHDAEEAMRMGDRIALLNKGRLVQVGSAEELYERPIDLFVAGFFSELNLFDARIENQMADTPIGRFPAPRFADGTEVTVAIRLAGLQVSESRGEIPARILSRRYLGLTEILDLAVPGAQSLVRAHIRRGNLRASQREISLKVDKSDVMVFEREAERA